MEKELEKLKEIIQKDVLIMGYLKKNGWIFDFRNIFLKPEPIALIADIFWARLEKEYPFQIGGQEMAAIPLISALVFKSQLAGKPVNGFVIRKSRKPTGLQKIIEGEINNEKIILVDDLINRGITASRQIKVLEGIGKYADCLFTLVRFRDPQYYEKFEKRGTKIISLFDLNDFNLTLGAKEKNIFPQNFKTIWRFQSPNPNFFQRMPKSAPILDEKKIYFGSDSGYFWALRQSDGTITWKFKVGSSNQKKRIFSTPALYKNTVYFGAYDGNVYALDRTSGKVIWKFDEADWISSTPAIAPDLNLLFIGLEFGLFKKHGGIAALELKTGEKKWEYREISEYVHCSPTYSPEKKKVAIGSDDCCLYLFDGKNGKLNWKFKTEGAIKAPPAFDIKRNLIILGSCDENLYALDLDSGKLKGKYKIEGAIFSAPVICGDNIYFSSVDKNIYSLNLETGKLNWRFAASGRIFASPLIIENKIYIGSTDGQVYEIDVVTGKQTDFFQTTERITNAIAYNSKTGIFFVPTYANEIYALEKIEESPPLS